MIAPSQIPLNQIGAISDCCVTVSTFSGSMFVTQDGLYRIYYGAAKQEEAQQDAAADAEDAIALSIDGVVVPGTTLPLSVSNQLIDATRLIYLASGQSIAITVASGSFTLAPFTNGSNAILSLQLVD